MSMQLSVVVPAYNEAHRIERNLEIIASFLDRECDQWEIIVVDDGSTDETSARAARFTRARVLCNEVNSGKGSSVRRGMLAAQLDPVLFTDADLSTPIDEALSLHRAIDEGHDIAIASRAGAAGKRVRRTIHRRLMAAVFRALVKVVALRGIRDTQCGFKMFRRSAARAVFPLGRLDRWGFDVEILHIARKLGLRIAEVPVSWEESPETRLRLTTPLTMIGDILRVRWNDLAGRYRP